MRAARAHDSSRWRLADRQAARLIGEGCQVPARQTVLPIALTETRPKSVTYSVRRAVAVREFAAQLAGTRAPTMAMTRPARARITISGTE